MTLASKVVVLNQGRVEQAGHERGAHDRPDERHVTHGIGSSLEDRLAIRHGRDAAGLLELVLQPLVEDCECSHEKKRLSRAGAGGVFAILTL